MESRILENRFMESQNHELDSSNPQNRKENNEFVILAFEDSTSILYNRI